MLILTLPSATSPPRPCSCGAPTITAEAKHSIERSYKEYAHQERMSAKKPTKDIRKYLIPIHVHVVGGADLIKNVTDPIISKQIKVGSMPSLPCVDETPDRRWCSVSFK